MSAMSLLCLHDLQNLPVPRDCASVKVWSWFAVGNITNMNLCSWRGRCCSSCRLRDLGRHMGMNMEQKMVEKFMSRRGQQKLTQDLLQLTWRTREDLMMGSMKSLTRCMSQIKCQNWNMYKKNKRTAESDPNTTDIRAGTPATSSGLWSKFFQRNKLKWTTEKTQEQLAMIHCKIWPWKAVVKRLI